ncbi:MAG: TVP38/TMEM64 family protein [Candidatus Omnitrophica bacterium]|nr:TVP38/TMEM64 family protein [Candidatus Omnitrophota bacterium]
MKKETRLKLALLVLLILAMGLVAVLVIYRGADASRFTPERVREFILSFGLWAPLIYFLLIVQPLVPIPGSVLTIGGGLAFGPLRGIGITWAGAVLRACLQFWISKYLGREAVSKLLKGKAVSMDEAVENHGFLTVLLVRLIPNAPYDLQNFALGLSSVRFRHFLAATMLGLVPWTIAFVYLGHSITEPENLWKVCLALGGIACLVIISHLVRLRLIQKS